MKTGQWVAALSSIAVMTIGGTAIAQDTEEVTAVGGSTNHSRFVEDFAVGLLGAGTIGLDGSPINLSAPVIGARYWMTEKMGIDAGIGIAMSGASNSAGDTTTDVPEPFGLVLHGGIPLVMADSQYVAFQVVPEMTIGLAGNTIEGNPDDTETDAFHFGLGARVGAEVHFGFIDMPQLSLQAGVGVALTYDRVSQTQGDVDGSASRWTFGTRGGSDPWDIFTSSVSALYYFEL